jgi:hypothetical protein
MIPPTDSAEHVDQLANLLEAAARDPHRPIGGSQRKATRACRRGHTHPAQPRRCPVTPRRVTATYSIIELARVASAHASEHEERRFRKILGNHDLANLAITTERDLDCRSTPSPNPEEVDTLITA